ncbi:hypothetical protein F4780DRAFT_719587 [Xylariomycetidae sp. FL0641]|nr:hypothetical protein F4780DRAFT_719587 [Xylariomycetidae sp. FL0641]
MDSSASTSSTCKPRPAFPLPFPPPHLLKLHRPDYDGDQWMWLELYHPELYSEGALPVGLDEGHTAGVILTIPVKCTDLKADFNPGWTKKSIRSKEDHIKELVTTGVESENPDSGLDGVGATMTWGLGNGMPCIQFKPKSERIRQLLKSQSEEFLAIPYVDPFPSAGGRAAQAEWYTSLREDMDKQACRWEVIRNLARNGALGIRLAATRKDYEEYSQKAAERQERDKTRAILEGKMTESFEHPALRRRHTAVAPTEAGPSSPTG